MLDKQKIIQTNTLKIVGQFAVPSEMGEASLRKQLRSENDLSASNKRFKIRPPSDRES